MGIVLILNVWGFYHVPILVAGVRNQRRGSRKEEKAPSPIETLPSFSVIVPVKDEEKVIGRLLQALVRLDYPREKKQIIIVEDGSVDKTVEICAQHARRYQGQIELIHGVMSNGKPSALNHALGHVKGDILAVFDADNVPEPDVLMKVAKYFEDTSIAGVQGRICSLNEDENVLTKIVSCEAAVWFETCMRGKDTLNLFVPIAGSNYFIRRSVLEEVGGWDSKFLCEDLELSARLVKKGHCLMYAPEVLSWQENPRKLTWLFRQRMRWFRGCMEVSLKCGNLVKKPSRRNVDAEVTFVGPSILALCFMNYFLGFFMMLNPVQPTPLLIMITQTLTFLSAFHLTAIGMSLVYATKLWKTRKLLWLPLIYAYWVLETFVATYALIQVALGRPQEWTKTMKNGTIASSAFRQREDLHMQVPQVDN